MTTKKAWYHAWRNARTLKTPTGSNISELQWHAYVCVARRSEGKIEKHPIPKDQLFEPDRRYCSVQLARENGHFGGLADDADDHDPSDGSTACPERGHPAAYTPPLWIRATIVHLSPLPDERAFHGMTDPPRAYSRGFGRSPNL